MTRKVLTPAQSVGGYTNAGRESDFSKRIIGLNAGHFVAGLQSRCKCSVDQAVQLIQVNVHTVRQPLGNAETKPNFPDGFLHNTHKRLFDDARARLGSAGKMVKSVAENLTCSGQIG